MTPDDATLRQAYRELDGCRTTESIDALVQAMRAMYDGGTPQPGLAEFFEAAASKRSALEAERDSLRRKRPR